ncbi:hypothetical protein GCM10009554_10480 [Kribbella koreensis]|uniref:Uncharacterized protein n=1 Tax=Kribbella koreensis TaxID=57909 RepID=A0ABN1PIB9_9ACTN
MLAISPEYTTGQIRTTFTVQTRRRLVLAAKAAVLTIVALVVGELMSLVSFLVAQQGLRSAHVNVSLSDGAAQRAVLGAGVYLVALTLLGLGLAAVIRHTAGAISAVYVLVSLALAVVLIGRRDA